MKSKQEHGFYLLFASRGPFYTTVMIIILPIVLDLAKFHRRGDGYIHMFGFLLRPSTFVFVVNSLTSLLIMILSPVVGAISDINNNRKKMIKYSSVVFLFAICLSFFLSFKSCWFLAAILQITTICIFELSSIMFNSYCPEIGNTQEDYSRLSSLSTVVESLSVLIFLSFLPLLLKTHRSRNLVSHGNFYYDSFNSWDFKYLENGDYKSIDCIKSRPETFTQNPQCWKESIGRGLKINIPDQSKIRMVQTDELTKTFSGEFSLSATINHPDADSNYLDMLMKVNQMDENKKIIKSSDKTITPTDKKNTFGQLSFLFDPNTRFVEFSIEFFGKRSTTAEIEVLETVMPIDSSQIRVIFFAGLFYSLVSIASLCFFADKETNRDVSFCSAVAGGFTGTIEALKESYKSKTIFLYLLVNMFWYGGYVVWSLLLIVYLEDKFALGSYNLALIFIVMCVSTILGALINYVLKSKVSPWTISVVVYGIWTCIPFVILSSGLNVPEYVYFFIIVFIGICYGIILSVRYAIYSDLISSSEEGKYMGIFYFTSKLMDFIGNIFILLAMKFMRLETITLLSSVFFWAAFICMIITMKFYPPTRNSEARREEDSVIRSYPGKTSILVEN